MLIAFATSVTLLPALLYLFKPPGEPEPLGYPALAPVDNFLARHRIKILTTVLVVVLAGSPLLYWVRFDFNPINLRSPKVESVATYLELRNDPENNVNNINILSPSLADADAIAAKLQALPEVRRATTLSTFVPTQQEDKLRPIQAAPKAPDPSLNQTEVMPPRSDDENIAAMTSAAQGLTNAAGSQNGPGAGAAKRLAVDLTALARAEKPVRVRADAA